ncbi:MAG: CotH kinase family protein [Bacteroidota bacterium]
MKKIVCTRWFILIMLGIGLSSPISGQLLVPEKTELYRDDVVPRIDVLIGQESLDFILDPANRESNELFEATFIFSNDVVNDTVENVGFRLRGNTSRSADKKSFKIDINEFMPGRKFYGVTKINLNGQHNDPTSARAKICADLADQIGIPSLRTNHVELYINGNYYGLYTNTEHIDQNYAKKRFGNKNGNLYKCLFPADLAYKGDSPNNYKEVVSGRRNYDLKSNEYADDYSDLANFIRVLNLTSDADLPCELENVFNVDLYLKTIIFDILTGNWDGPIYNKNNFYLYHNQFTSQFEYIPYDLDNTLGIDWLSRDWGNRDIYAWSRTGEDRPIYTRLMANQEYRDRFSFYMQEILLDIYNEAELYPYLDDIRDKLLEFIEDDTFYKLDYGFSSEDFLNGFEFPLGFFQTDYGIKEFIQTRLIAAFNQLEFNDIHPVITNVTYNHPNEDEDLIINAQVIDNGTIEDVFFINHITAESVRMHDDGAHNDGEANDGVYGIEQPAFQLGSNDINFSIKASDNLGKEASYPRCGGIEFKIEEVELKLAINEFMASNEASVQDELEEYDDWIEIFNYGTRPIFLGDKFLSDNPDNEDKWAMPHYTIQGGEYLIIWADDDRNQGEFHTNFKLQKSGEYIGIFDNDETVIDDLKYNEQDTDISRGRIPNGTGNYIFMAPTPGASNIGVSATESEVALQL